MMCSLCQEHPPETNKRRCVYCNEKYSNYARMKKKKLRDRGLCIICGREPPVGSINMCANCREIVRIRNRQQREKRKNLGICGYCRLKMKNSADGMVYCLECRMKLRIINKARREERKLVNLCTICGKPRGRSLHCNDCRQKEIIMVRELRGIVFEAYGNRCNCCGESIIEFLQIDHVYGGGCKHRKKYHGSMKGLYREIIKEEFPDKYQILCANCNWGKSRNGGVCPHITYNNIVETTE